MRIALFSDVHGNLSALEAVMREIDREGADLVVCLGDLVGYGGEPEECVEAVRSFANVVVAGNHDRDATADGVSEGTNGVAATVLEWTRGRLGERSRSYLDALPNVVAHDAGFLAVHGCYLNEKHYVGYVTTTMLEMNLLAIRDAQHGGHVGFCGHTHWPMLAWLQGDDVFEGETRNTTEWPGDASAVLINPGAVGQPRDGNPHAAFVIIDLDEKTVEWRRVVYDLERTREGILKAGLPEILCRRLEEGR